MYKGIVLGGAQNSGYGSSTARVAQMHAGHGTHTKERQPRHANPTGRKDAADAAAEAVAAATHTLRQERLTKAAQQQEERRLLEEERVTHFQASHGAKHTHRTQA
jgi:hypothetical protein